MSLGITLTEIISVMMVVLLGCMLAIRRNKRINVVSFATFFGGFGTMAMMAFSPTIHVSGVRPLFIGFLCGILCTISLCAEIFYDQKGKKMEDKETTH